MIKKMPTLAILLGAASLMSFSAIANEAPKNAAGWTDSKDRWTWYNGGEPTNTKEWAEQASDAINDVIYYPRVAKGQGITGMATFQVVVDRKGEVLDYFRAESTGRDVLDNAALHALKKANFPPIPASFAGDRLTFSLEMAYVQRESRARQTYLDAQKRKGGVVTGTRIAILGGTGLGIASAP